MLPDQGAAGDIFYHFENIVPKVAWQEHSFPRILRGVYARYFCHLIQERP